MTIRKINGNTYQEVAVVGDSDSPLPVAPGGRAIPAWDYRELGYTGANLTTVTYKAGGSGGTVVAVQTLAYDGSDNLISETWS